MNEQTSRKCRDCGYILAKNQACGAHLIPDGNGRERACFGIPEATHFERTIIQAESAFWDVIRKQYEEVVDEKMDSQVRLYRAMEEAAGRWLERNRAAPAYAPKKRACPLCGGDDILAEWMDPDNVLPCGKCCEKMSATSG